MKVIIAGSRDFFDLKIVRKELEALKDSGWVFDVVVSGTARGADRAGECWAQENNVPIRAFPADWNNWGKAAGFIRNSEMAKYADALVAFWDGASSGTDHMIREMRRLGKQIRIVRV